MKKKVMSILVASAFALALSFPMATSADPGPSPSKRPTVTALHTNTQDRDDRERHPEIRDAMNLLNQAQDRLSHAAHDFHGHRTKAMKHISAAIEELNLALRSDRH